MERILKKGTVITCPVCKIDLYETAHDLREGDQIKADLMIPIGLVKKPIDGVPIVCTNCFADLARIKNARLQLHTKDGWI